MLALSRATTRHGAVLTPGGQPGPVHSELLVGNGVTVCGAGLAGPQPLDHAGIREHRQRLL
jgi:hypothetical protein